jgi:predicted metalloendopeptidase
MATTNCNLDGGEAKHGDSTWRRFKQKGTAPLAPDFQHIAALNSVGDLPALLADLHAIGVNAFFTFGADGDFKDAKTVIGTLGQASLDRMSRRDPSKVYHKMTPAELQALAPGFEWSAYFRDLKTYLRWHVVQGVEAALGQDIATLPWMTEATKQLALVKLHAVSNKIGYPDRWRDYSALRIIRGDLLGNSHRANAFEFHRQLNRIGKPLDKSEWEMTPPTVNAYYEAVENNINFPAVNGVVSNMPEFQKAFSCKPDAPMARGSACRVW